MLKVLDWNAWAPGLDSKEKWLDWFKNPMPLASDEKAPVKFISPMIRRRLSPLGRAVVEALHPIYDQESDQNTPIVFASRWGDIDLTVKLLESLTTEGDVSPTAFSTSVHNAIGGLFSIIFKHHGNISALSGASACTSAAIYEALGLLTEHPSVIVCIYDDQTPNAFADFHPVNFPFAYCLRLSLAKDSEEGFSIQSAPSQTQTETTDTTKELEVLAFLATDLESCVQNTKQISYVWSKSNPL